MKRLRTILIGALLAIAGVLYGIPANAENAPDPEATEESNPVDVKGIVFGHIGDGYEWHITDIGDTHVTIPLPIIVHSSTTGWHAFLSSRLEENGGTYEGFSIAPTGSPYEGKLVEHDASGNEVRPLDISITKVTLTLLIKRLMMVIIVLSVSR